MKRIFGMAASLLAFSSAQADGPRLCTQEDVREALLNQEGYKEAYKSGVLPKIDYLEQERTGFMAQRCAGNISQEEFCRSMIANWKEHMSLAKMAAERGFRREKFTRYVEGLLQLQAKCSESFPD